MLLLNKIKKSLFNLRISVLILLCLFCCSAQFLYAQDTSKIQGQNLQKNGVKVLLTAEETDWLKRHPDIRFGYTDIFEPQVVSNPDGSVEGILVDFLDEINLRLGTRIKLDILPVPELLDKARGKKIDGILNILPKYAQNLGMIPTREHIHNYPAVFARKNTIFNHPSDLAQKRVAIVDKVYFAEQIVKEYGIGAMVIKVKDPLEGFQLLQKDQADFFIAASLNTYHLNKYLLLNLTTQYIFHDTPIKHAISVRSDWPMLVSILNKAIAGFSNPELQAFSAKWLHALPEKKQIKLTAQEQAWLKQHPTLRFGFMKGYDPYLMVDENQNQSGILVDLGKELGRILGIDIVIDPAETILQGLEKSEKKEIDVVYIINPQRADKRKLLKSNVFLKTYTALYAREGIIVKTLDDMAGKTIAIPEEARYAALVVEPYKEKATKIINAPSPLDGLRMLVNKEADIYVGTTTNNYLVNKYRLFGVREAYVKTDQSSDFVMGIRNDWPLLPSIINKALDALPKRGVETIVTKWVGSIVNQTPYQKKEVIEFAAREKAWLAKNHTVRVRVINFPPFMILEKNSAPKGIVIDYLNLIAEQTGVTFNYEFSTDVFTTALDGLKKHQGPDLIANMMQTSDREKAMLFSQPYFRSPYVIFAPEKDNRFVNNMADMASLKIALANGTVLHERVKKAFPDLNLAAFKNDAAAIEAVATKKADAYIGNLVLASHLILEKGLTGLRIAGPTPFGDHVFSMGIRSDWPELVSLINKGFAAIPPEDNTKIKNKYVSIQYDHAETGVIIKWSLIIGGGSLCILLLFAFWNRSLKKQVVGRTAELSGMNKALKTEVSKHIQTENDLRKSEERFRATFDQAAVGIAHVSPDGRFLRINQKFCDIVGYSKEEMLKLSFQEITHPDDLDMDLDFVRKILDGKIDTYSIEKRYRQKNGGFIWILLTVSLVRNKSGEPKWAVSVVKDISERKKTEKKINEYQNRLQALASQLTLVEEKERRRIAAGLHDDIGQTLAFSRIQVARAKKYAREDKQKAILDELSHSLLGTIQATKEMVFDLSSPFLNELGLSAAIANWLKDQILKKHNIRTRFIDKTEQTPLDHNLRLILFRNVRELLTNVIKHARAEQIIVTLQETNQEFQISVQDNGIGFDPEAMADQEKNSSGFGLFNIRERMTDYGGTMNIISTPGNGCQTILSVPIWKTIENKEH